MTEGVAAMYTCAATITIGRCFTCAMTAIYAPGTAAMAGETNAMAPTARMFTST